MKSFKESINLEENMSWKVEIEGLPHMYFNGRSAGAVKNELRKILKSPGQVIKSITRVTPTEIKKDFRLRLTDKNDLEGEPVAEGIKTIKVGEDAVGTDKEPHYAVVNKRKVMVTGSKEDMIEYCRENGGRVWKTTAKVGDIVEGADMEDELERREKQKIRQKVDMEEGKMKEFHGYMDSGKSAQWIAKKMKLDLKTVQALMKESVKKSAFSKFLEAVDASDTGGEEEVSMVKNQMKQIRHYIDGIEKMVADDGDIEEWAQNKLTKATDYLKSVYGYKTGKVEESTVEYGKSIERQNDAKKKAAIKKSDKEKLGAIAQMMAREREKKQKELALKSRKKGDFETARKHDQAAMKAKQ